MDVQLKMEEYKKKAYSEYISLESDVKAVFSSILNGYYFLDDIDETYNQIRSALVRLHSIRDRARKLQDIFEKTQTYILDNFINDMFKEKTGSDINGSRVRLGVWWFCGTYITVVDDSYKTIKKTDKMLLIPRNRGGMDNLDDILGHKRGHNKVIRRSELERIKKDLIIGSAPQGGEIGRMVLENKNPSDIINALGYYDFVCIAPARKRYVVSKKISQKHGRRVYDICKTQDIPAVFCETGRQCDSITDRIVASSNDWGEDFEDLYFKNPQKIMWMICDKEIKEIMTDKDRMCPCEDVESNI